jgi:hypothetical protein
MVGNTPNPELDLEHSLMERLEQKGMSDLWSLGMHNYLAYGAVPDFIVDLDDIFVAIGFGCREDAKAILIEKMSACEDYDSFLRKGANGTRITEVITLTVDAFKKLCMFAKTDSSMRILECYLAMEAVYAAKQLKISTAAQVAAVKLQAQLDLAQAKTYSEVPKPEWVYICKEAAELAGDAHKIGRTIDTRKRESSLNTGSAQGAKILYERATHNSKAVEDLIKAVMKRYHISSAGGTEHFRCHTEHSVAISDAGCVVVDTLASCYESMPRAEIFKLLSSRMLEEGAREWSPPPAQDKVPVEATDATRSGTIKATRTEATKAMVVETGMQELRKLGLLDKIVELPDGRTFLFDDTCSVWGLASSKQVTSAICTALNHLDCVKSGTAVPGIVKAVLRMPVDCDFLAQLDRPIYGCAPWANGMFDAISKEMRPLTMEDHVSVTTGYKLIAREDVPAEAYKKVEGFYKTLFPRREEMDLFMQVVSNALFGVGDAKHFIVLSDKGSGRTGKTTLMTFIGWMFGGLGKRLVFVDDPHNNGTMDIARLKELTSCLNGRGGRFAQPLVVVAAKKSSFPQMNASSDEVFLQRMVAIIMCAKFVPEGAPRQQGARTTHHINLSVLNNLRSDECLSAHVHMLANSFQEYTRLNGKIVLPKDSKEFVSNIVSESDPLFAAVQESLHDCIEAVVGGTVNKSDVVDRAWKWMVLHYSKTFLNGKKTLFKTLLTNGVTKMGGGIKSRGTPNIVGVKNVFTGVQFRNP